MLLVGNYIEQYNKKLLLKLFFIILFYSLDIFNYPGASGIGRVP